MRTYLILSLVAVLGLGCSQMRYAGRYQEVKIESEPSGASVLVEGNINTLAPVGVKGEGGTELAYSSPMQLKTPVVLILDKENPEYNIKVAYEGFPEFEKVLKPRFAFHPYLIIAFPIVPLWSDYEINRFDDVFVDFNAVRAQLEAKAIGEADEIVAQAELAYTQECDKIDSIRSRLEEARNSHAEAETAVTELEGKVKEAEEALESADEDGKEEAQKNLDNLNEELQNARNAGDELQGKIEELQAELDSAEAVQLEAKGKLDDAKQIRAALEKTEEKGEEKGEEKPESE